MALAAVFSVAICFWSYIFVGVLCFVLFGGVVLLSFLVLQLSHLRGKENWLLVALLKLCSCWCVGVQ